MEEKIEQDLRLLAMDIREYMSQEKWVDDAKRALYPIIFSNQVEPPVILPNEMINKFKKFIDEQKDLDPYILTLLNEFEKTTSKNTPSKLRF